MDWDLARARTKIAFDILKSVVGFILGIAMIAQGVHRTYTGIDDGAEFLYFCGSTVMILGGISVIILSRKSLVKMTGAYAITLGLSRVFLRFNDINNMTDPRLIFLEIIMLVLAVNLIRVGIYFVKGDVISRTSMIISSSILASTDLLILIVNYYVEEFLDFLPFKIDSYFYLMNFLMFVALIALMDTEAIRESTDMARHAKVLDRVRTAYSLEDKSYIYTDVAQGLLERSGPLWKDVNDGTVVSEMTFNVYTDEHEATAVAQIWEGKEPLYLTVVNKGDSVFNANRFRVDELKESDGVLYGYGKDGTRFTVMIKERVLQ